MQITILTVGSRGDVQPYVALGQGLQRAGYSVRIATHGRFRELVEAHGMAYSPVNGDPMSAIRAEAGQSWLETGSNPVTFVRRMLDVAQPMMAQILEDYWQACEGADMVLYPVLATLAAVGIGESMGIPVVPAYLQYVHPTGRYPFPLMKPRRGWEGLPNRLSHAFAEQAFWLFTRSPVNRWRTQTLGLEPYGWRSRFMERLAQRPLCLYGFSRHVVPKAPEWDERVLLSGYWSLDAPEDWRPPADLLDFLADGPPPVYIGFGSMANRDPARVTEISLDALRRSGQRGLLLSGWAGLGNRDLPDTVFKIEHAPHDWLFPRMAAVVHHGGAGTTAAGLRAGVPSVVVPYFADQPFWGWRVAQLGVGPSPIPRAKLSPGRLTAAITEAVYNPRMRARAAALGQTLRAEDGVANAVAALKRHGLTEPVRPGE